VHPPSLGRKPLPSKAHHPDYARIAELERELGINQPPPPTVAEVQARIAKLEQGGPFLRHSQPGRAVGFAAWLAEQHRNQHPEEG
jgi:hypothetical protein